MVVVETEKFLIEKKLKRFLSLKVIDDLPSFFLLTREVMEYIDKFKELTGQEKKLLVKENVVLLLRRQSIFESINMYISLLEPYIEVLITISKTKLLLNIVDAGCFKGCF